jgi:pSer/pThr/pTyr-binding forkhead associated (FHA) protein
MKLSLVVAAGVHKGKPIPIPTPQFLIGRDPSCQLRPASELVSKRHCAVLVRDGKILVRDFGSTNGTYVNDQPVAEEVEVKNGDKLKVGPLEFELRVEETAVKLAAKPALVAVKAAKPAPEPKPESKPAEAPTPTTTTKIDHTSAEHDTSEEVALDTPAPSDDPHSDKIAALLLGLGADDPADQPQVPEGSTEMEIPALNDPNSALKPGGKKEAPKPTYGDTSTAAEAILKKYRQRPRT